MPMLKNLNGGKLIFVYLPPTIICGTVLSLLYALFALRELLNELCWIFKIIVEMHLNPPVFQQPFQATT